MRLLATHNDKEVVIIQMLYEGEKNENLKAIFYDGEGEIGVDDVANFVINDTKARITES